MYLFLILTCSGLEETVEDASTARKNVYKATGEAG
jgi:hypothetical protein